MLWDIPAGRILGRTTLEAPSALAFSPDGRWLAVGDAFLGWGMDTAKIRLWTVALFKKLFC
jgi:hypothetical protein